MKPQFENYVAYYNTLTQDSVGNLRSLASPDLHFVDPFNDVVGVEKVIRIFNEMFHKLSAPSFKVTDALEQGDKLFVRWLFEFRSPFIKFGNPHSIVGVSVIEAKEGKIISHLDYWDASSQLYMHLPVIGLLIRGLRRFFA